MLQYRNNSSIGAPALALLMLCMLQHAAAALAATPQGLFCAIKSESKHIILSEHMNLVDSVGLFNKFVRLPPGMKSFTVRILAIIMRSEQCEADNV